MKISNSNDYFNAPFELTTQDLAIIFDELDLGIQTQMKIAESIWKNHSWILEKKYREKNKKKQFLQSVLYQVNYLYHKNEIDSSLNVISQNAHELGYSININSYIEDYCVISKFFKKLWVQINFLSDSGYTRAKLKTILNKYNYRRRSEKFCNYFIQCLNFYKIRPYVNGVICDIRKIPLNTMITFRKVGNRTKHLK